jgi:hypothetical protein
MTMPARATKARATDLEAFDQGWLARPAAGYPARGRFFRSSHDGSL